MKLRNQRDFWSGMMFVAIGILFVFLSRQYQLGTAAKMGPGYFPTVLGGLLAVIGAITAFDSFAKHQPMLKLERVGWKELILLLAGIALFATALPKLGVVISIILLITISAIASHEFRLRDTLISIVVLLIMSYFVFIKGLELQFPVWPKFLTN